MKLNKSHIISLAIVLASFIIGIILYPYFPEKMAGHWNSAGEVDGYMSKFWGVFLMPVIGAIMYGLFLVVPRIDPRKENIEKFRNYFDNFIILFLFFLFYLYGLTLWWNLGNVFNMTMFLIPAFAVLFYYVGVLVGKAQSNFSIGIRTPWTLSSEEVWRKTHSLGGKLFRIAGICALSGLFFPTIAIWLVIVPVIGVSIFIMFYSYFEYHRTETKNK